MGLDLQLLGNKLLRYREQLQETQDEVAIATGISKARLGQLELGQIAPTGDEILILADHFRCDYKFFVSDERLAPFEQTESLYRLCGNELSKQDRRSIQEFLYLCETEAFLMSELGIQADAFSYVPRGSHFKTHGEQAASALRKHLGYSDRVVPRDVYADCRRLGVHVFRRKLANSAISGLFVSHPTAGKCVLVNFDEDVFRQRFSAAHELAHAILDATDEPVSVSYASKSGRDLKELRANRFASCFLLSPTMLQSLPKPTEWTAANTIHWASELMVSCDALGVALKEAGVADNDAVARIRATRVPRAMKRDPELVGDLTELQRQRKLDLLQRGLSQAYVDLCFDAVQRDVISGGRLTEALLCTHAELPELAAIFKRRPHGD